MLELETAARRAMPEPAPALLGAYEGLRRYDMLPGGRAASPTAVAPVAGGVTRSAELSQVPLLPGGRRAAAICSPRAGSTRICSRSTCATGTRGGSLLRRGVVGRAARDPARERRRAVRAQRPAQAAAAAHARARQAHRQRLGGRGAVLPPLQDDPAPAHEHGQGRAEHDDAHVRGRLPGRRHPHEQRRHRLGDRRGPGRRSPSRRPPSTASGRRSTSSTAPRASSTRSSTASTPASHVWGQFLKDYRPTDW